MEDTKPATRPDAAPSRDTLIAFAGFIFLGAGATVAVKLTVQELEPLWAAALRYTFAAAFLGVISVVCRLRMPRGRALAGVLIYGLLNIGLAFGFINTALTEVSAGTMQVLVSLGPIVVILLSAAYGIERLRPGALLGAVIAALGALIVFRDSLGVASLRSLLLLMIGVFCIAQAMVLVKRYPAVNPVVQNAVGQAVGAVALMVFSVLTGESHATPHEAVTYAALAYLVVGGSALYMLMLYVIQSWTASATSYAMVLMPAVTVPLAAVLLDEPVTMRFLLGCAVIFLGLYVGVLRRPPARRAR